METSPFLDIAAQDRFIAHRQNFAPICAQHTMKQSAGFRRRGWIWGGTTTGLSFFPLYIPQTTLLCASRAINC